MSFKEFSHNTGLGLILAGSALVTAYIGNEAYTQLEERRFNTPKVTYENHKPRFIKVEGKTLPFNGEYFRRHSEP
jgi:hypothetical protein